MSAAMPYIRFFPRDWTGDPLLRMVGPAERGLWIDLLCIMAACDPYGHLAMAGNPMPDERAAAAVSLPLETYRILLASLEAVGIASRTSAGALFSRRLVRDHEEFMRSSRAGRAGGGNPALRAQENIHKPSPSPYARRPKGGINPPINPPIKGVGVTSTPEFDAFWAAYPRKTAKKEALKAWNKAKDKPAVDNIIAAVARAKTSEQWQKDGGQYIPHPATWLNQGRWDDGGIVIVGTSSTQESRASVKDREMRDDLEFNLGTWRTDEKWDVGFDRAACRASAVSKHGPSAGPVFDEIITRMESRKTAP